MKRVAGRGAMAVVELSLEEARQAIRGYGDRLSVAVSNSSRSTVVSGDTDAIEELLLELERREIFARRVKVDVASHSPHMDPLMGELGTALEGLRAGPATIPLLDRDGPAGDGLQDGLARTGPQPARAGALRAVRGLVRTVVCS
jgi:acyl transferase domain-containing protein